MQMGDEDVYVFMPGPIIIVLSRLELLKVVMVFIGQNFLINPF